MRTKTPLKPEDILERLIGFDTVSRNPNLALVEFVADLLDGHGIEVEIQRSEDGRKANLFATIGPAGMGGSGSCRRATASSR